MFVGLAGRGIQASRSNILEIASEEFALNGLSGARIDEIAARTRASKRMIYYYFDDKESLYVAALDELSPEAQAIGAVNTIVIRDGRCVGHNTDSWGFAESLRQARPALPIERVVQLGAGGAGAAVAHALDGLGVGELVIIDQSPERAEVLTARLGQRSSHVFKASRAVEEEIGRAEGIVNATPVGMANYPGTPFPSKLLSARHWVADIVYFPEDTELLRAARKAGCRTVPGSGMAVYQAVRAFELFTGVQPDVASMTQHFRAAA
ncbi:MAG: shikimate dehydrogenase [Rhizobiales bacterium]|nr:shikimate dehydrogenase [Hyphomicrobiales bacterium]